MAASNQDKITDVRNAARPNSARVSSGRSAGGTTLACDNLAGWPTASKVHFVTYQIDSNSNPVAGSQLDCYGIRSGNNITSLVVVDGTDAGNLVNDVVEMLPTAAWGQDLSDALMVGHTRTGVHAASLPLTTPVLTTPTITDFTNATHTHANAAGGGQIANSGISGVGTEKLSNPYKFSAYVTAAQNVGTADTLVQFDTKHFDTSSNLDIVTHKGRFTAPIAGFYQFNTNIVVGTAGTAIGLSVSFYKNGALINTGSKEPSINSGTDPRVAASVFLQLSANDYVEVYAGSVTAAKALDVSAPSVNNVFSGFLVSAT